MQCPKCPSPMNAVTHDGITVQRCSGCQGLWFNAADHEALRGAADTIDTGTAAGTGQAAAKLPCPTCANSTLIDMVDAAQPHIHFESCPVCHGRFFDAGEFRDFAEHGLGEFLRNFFAPARA